MKDDERTRKRRRMKRRPMRRRGLQLVVMLVLLSLSLFCRWKRAMCRIDYHGVRDSYGMTRGKGIGSSIRWNTLRTPPMMACWTDLWILKSSPYYSSQSCLLGLLPVFYGSFVEWMLDY